VDRVELAGPPVLAVVQYARAAHGVTEWCRLHPIFIATGGRWEPISPAHAREEFPWEGSIYWHRPDDVREGSVWVVQYTENLHLAGKNKKKDKYVVEAATPAPVFVTAGAFPDDLALRRGIADGSCSFSAAGSGPVFLHIPSSGSNWVGPLAIDPTRSENGHYHTAASAAQAFVEIVEVPKEALQRLSYENKELVTLLPERSIEPSVGWFNVQADDQLLDGVLKRIRKLNRQAADSLKVTQAVYGKYIEALHQAELVGTQEQYETARERALSLLIQQASLRSAQTAAIAETLLSWPSVTAEVERAVSVRVQQAAGQIRQDAEAREATALSSAQAAETRLDEVRQRTSTETAALETQLAQLRSQAGELPTKLLESLRNATQRFSADPSSFIADALFKQVIANAVGGNSERPTNATAVKLRLRSASIQADTLRDVVVSARLSANSHQSDREAIIVAAAFALAGKSSLILVGPAAEESAIALSKCLAGGNILHFSVPATVYGVADVLDLCPLDPASLEPVDVRLADVLRGDGPRPVLAVLSGIDRAPLEVSLADIALRRSNAPVVRPDGSERSDPPGLFGGSLSTMLPGPSTFRIPRSLRSHVAVVYMGWNNEAGAGSEGEPPRTAASMSIVQPDPISSLPPEVAKAINEAGVSASAACREIDWICAAVGNEARGLRWWCLSRLSGLLSESELKRLVDGLGGRRDDVQIPGLDVMIHAVSDTTQAE
jgi:hypothetical protein